MCVVFVVELNVKVIPVKYGRKLTLTHYKLESNIFTKQSHASTTTFTLFSTPTSRNFMLLKDKYHLFYMKHISEMVNIHKTIEAFIKEFDMRII